ncbi:hypothetical protein HNR50_002000 [Spirochaeta isovalerica]|uniref:Uncharacterized protein n=1 Tax=Spirochaeta isovalerica TaxID=150 RepID=A0A841RAR2_9SPIO|nr:hypothetical protein [Spirochaeta isovalerica]
MESLRPLFITGFIFLLSPIFCQTTGISGRDLPEPWTSRPGDIAP